ncbi:MAG: hypothetical protein ABSH47_08740 [Bryobacteraceae bacterium]
MRVIVFVFLALCSAGECIGANSGFLLGIDFTTTGYNYGTQMATDGSGAFYFLGNCPASSSSSCVTKLTDGKTMTWQYSLGLIAGAIAVDPAGGVYVTVPDPTTSGLFWVDKLSADGTSIVWKVPVAWGLWSGNPLLTVDSTGRAYVAYYELSQTFVVRVSADGSGRDYMVQLPGQPDYLAASGSGSAILVTEASSGSNCVLTWLSADGSSQPYTASLDSCPTAMAADPAGDVGIMTYSNSNMSFALLHFDPHGVQTFSETLPGIPWVISPYADMPEVTQAQEFPSVAIDAGGNTYVAVGAHLAHAVKNSLGACGGSSLMVYGPDGSLLQSTYLPDTLEPPENLGPPNFPQWAAYKPLLSVSPRSVVYVGTSGPLIRLSPNAEAKPLPLACVANAASYATGAVAPGEIVVLYGNGLGPQAGIQTQATMQTPFPTLAGNVTVTFDDKAAPLLWVQDGQINAVVPWSLTAGQNTSICVSNDSVRTNCLSLPVAQSAPGVFTVDGISAAALNQDGTVNSPGNPDYFESEITVYATGLGPISPSQADGSLVGLPLPVNVIPVGVFTMGPPLPTLEQSGVLGIDYAGPAPYELAGVTQVNCHLLNSLPPNPSVITLPSQSTGSNFFNYFLTFSRP